MYEYQNFGNSIVRREAQSTDDWETCADDDMDARVAMGVKQHLRETRETQGAPSLALVVTRGERNERIGARWGMKGDKLAEIMNITVYNFTERIPAEEFDAIMI